MYKRQTLGLKKEEVSANHRRGGGSARRTVRGVMGFQVNGSFGPLQWRLTRLDLLGRLESSDAERSHEPGPDLFPPAPAAC